MLATTGGEMWLLTTPHGARGFFYREWIDARFGRGPRRRRISRRCWYSLARSQGEKAADTLPGLT